MQGITSSRHGNCPSNFRIHNTKIMKEIGFSDKQMESREFVKRAENASYKVGVFSKEDKFVVLHWKLSNNGYKEGFTNYKTYERYWWRKEN